MSGGLTFVFTYGVYQGSTRGSTTGLSIVELESLGGGPVRDATCHVRPLRQGFNRQSERKRANDVKVLSCFGVY